LGVVLSVSLPVAFDDPEDEQAAAARATVTTKAMNPT